MAKKTEKREKCTLQDLAYGKKTEKTWKHTHTHTHTHIDTHCRTWNMTRNTEKRGKRDTHTEDLE